MYRFKVVITSLALLIAGVEMPQARAYNEAPLNFQDLNQKLKAAILSCPERVWPGFSLKSVNLLLAADGHKSSVARLGQGTISELKLSEVPQGAFESLYSFPVFDGATAGAFYFSSEDQENYSYNLTDQALRLIIHESFHRFGQANWKLAATAQRGTLYPMNGLPRLYRRMMFGRLNEYFSSGGKDLKGLAKAAFWNQQWKKDFPTDQANALDQMEGTAKYVELVAAILTEGGCGLTEKEIFNILIDEFSGEYRSFLRVPFQAEFEGYDIGALAAFSLRFVRNKRGWEDRVAKGESPLDLILEGVDPMNDEIPLGLKIPMMKAAQEKNHRYAELLKPDIELAKSKDSVRLVPSDTSFQAGAFTSRGFFQLQEIQGVVAIALAAPVKFSERGWQLNVGPEKLLLSGAKANPCSGEYFIVVPKSDLKLNTIGIEVNLPGLKGSMPGAMKIDSKGRQWFCDSGPGIAETR